MDSSSCPRQQPYARLTAKTRGRGLGLVGELLPFLVVGGGFAAVMGGLAWLASRARRRGVGGSVMGGISESEPPSDGVRPELVGKNLACWCPFDALPCLGQTLLDVAEGGSVWASTSTTSASPRPSGELPRDASHLTADTPEERGAT